MLALNQVKDSLAKVLLKEQDFDRDYFNELCNEIDSPNQRDEKDENLSQWISNFYNGKNPYENDEIMTFLIGFSTVTVSNYFFSKDEYIRYIKSFSPEYAEKMNKFDGTRDDWFRTRIIFNFIDCLEKKPDKYDSSGVITFEGTFKGFEENKEFVDKVLEKNPEYKTKWIKILDGFCDLHPFKYKIHDDVEIHMGKNYVTKITFGISTDKDQILIFKTPLTELQAISRAERWLSKPLTYKYYDYIKEDVGIEWENIPEEWVNRGDCLGDRKKIMKVIKDDTCIYLDTDISTS